ncbi:MAG: outer membrane lipoprotein carrier protein LolA [Alphaproteobacteria bacterium]|nr:outer membrane lipoprotein carrier protein LolA [Alphaproteobacteria bacterium]MCZ6848648.1 outer membrane lipoprotein carrier protein LolA [Alphaproteobacteria bacterium]
MTRPARRLVPIRAALALLAAIFLAAPMVSGALPGTALAQGMETRADITARIERYLNSITTLRARFLQISPAGDIARGTVLMSRPGKMRIDYDPPVPVLIVTEGSWLMLYDKELEASSYTSLNDSLAGFLVRPRIQLGGDVMVRDLDRGKGVIRVTMVRRDAPESGALTLVFGEKPLSLRQWTIVDGRGGETRVALENPQFNGKIEAKEFEFTPPEREDDSE